MQGLSFGEARDLVRKRVLQMRTPPLVESVPLGSANGRVLAADVVADRDYPSLSRSIRDGFAIRAQDLPGELDVIGEVRAGQMPDRAVGLGQAIEIMTGAPVPEGADAVVMVEHTERAGGKVRISRTQKPGDFLNPAGSEARRGGVLLEAGERITFPRVAMLASAGVAHPLVYRKPVVAIVSTGDEVVNVEANPLPHQIRNSNAWTLAAQVMRAGGEARIFPIAPDEYHTTREWIERGLEHDLLLLSGGVSAGKYDIVEQVLSDLGAEFDFTRVRIQPGQPVVFGHVRERFFFGLPGNPASTMVTFEIFARAAVELLSGLREAYFPLTYARLAADFRHKTGLTRFLPARVEDEGLTVRHVPWQGSSDVPALSRANAFLVADEAREFWQAGEMIPVLLI